MYTKERVIPTCGCELSRGGEGILYIRYCPKHKAAPELYEALQEIAKGMGRFSLDQLTYAENTIEDMQALAVKALAKAEGE